MRVSQQIGWSQESKLIYQLIKETDRLNELLPGNQPAANTTRVSRMIGWSNEANLYYEWLRSLDKLTQHYGCPDCTTTSTTTAIPPTPDSFCVTIPGWAITNLNVTTYANGDTIPEVQDPTAWAALTTGAWCSYDNNPANDLIYGKLYNWFAVNDPRGLAPTGYHVPSVTEFNTLITCLGGETIAGGKMKEAGLTHWASPNTGATNSSGFTGLPAGVRASLGAFGNLGLSGSWWSSTELDTTYAWTLNSVNYLEEVYFNDVVKYAGFSVRVIQD